MVIEVFLDNTLLDQRDFEVPPRVGDHLTLSANEHYRVEQCRHVRNNRNGRYEYQVRVTRV